MISIIKTAIPIISSMDMMRQLDSRDEIMSKEEGTIAVK